MARARAQAAEQILGWKDDPGAPGSGRRPLPRPVPKLDTPPLRIAIRGTAPRPKQYEPGTKSFRYWAAAEALRRGADFWASHLPSGLTWFGTVGSRLRIGLDEGEDLNAYYDRRGLQFFHASVEGTMVFSGESPDVLCHELGHAVLDAARPHMWDAASIEVAAFHESFGDMSAILSALQLRTARDELLVVAHGGSIYRSTRYSRLAEQLGWGIRQSAPDAVDPDSLRNAVNSFFYRDPATLPPRAPSSLLSPEPHSFSRVFTAGFLEALAGMLAVTGAPTDANLKQVASDMGQLLVDGVRQSPVVPSYYSQVAAHMVAADADRFGGRYRDALRGAFVRHCILSLSSAITLREAQGAPRALAGAAAPTGDALPRIALPGSE